MALHLFTGIPVADYAAALPWYVRFFGRQPSFLPHDTEAVSARAPATHRDHNHSSQMFNYPVRPHPGAAQLPRKRQLTALK